MKKERQVTLSRKITIFFVLLATIAMLTLALSSFFIIRDSQIKEYTKYNEKILELTASSISSQIKQILDQSLFPYSNTQIYSILTSDGPLPEANDTIRNTLRTILNSNSLINQISLSSVSQNMEYFIGEHNSSVQRVASITEPERENISEVDIYSREQQNNDSSVNKEGSNSVITISRSLYAFPKEKYLGELSIDFTLPSFTDKNKVITTNKNEALALLFPDSLSLYAPSVSEEFFNIIKATKFNNDNGVITTKGTKQYTILYQIIEPSSAIEPCFIIKVIETAKINQNQKSFALMFLGISLLIILIAIFFIYQIALKYTEPFKYMEQQLEKVSEGNLNVKMDLKNQDEFGSLARHFNDMIASINNLIIKEYQLELENKNNQIKALQAQLDPHFISNVLQNLGLEALESNNMELYLSIIHFGELMRYTMNIKNLNVKFIDEVEYTNNYIRFQEKRWPNRFNYSLDIEEDTESIIVPKLILQPIVENCFKHGFNETINFISISVKSWIKNNIFYVECSNTGASLTSNELTRLRSLIEKAKYSSDLDQNIGLRNLSRRLYLLYNDKAKLIVETQSNEGFTVRLEIEIEEGKDV